MRCWFKTFQNKIILYFNHLNKLKFWEAAYHRDQLFLSMKFQSVPSSRHSPSCVFLPVFEVTALESTVVLKLFQETFLAVRQRLGKIILFVRSALSSLDCPILSCVDQAKGFCLKNDLCWKHKLNIWLIEYGCIYSVTFSFIYLLF